MPTDKLNLKTVGDVVSFVTTLKILPKEIPSIVNAVRERNIDAEKFFNARDGLSMQELLNISNLHVSWGEMFYQLIL